MKISLAEKIHFTKKLSQGPIASIMGGAATHRSGNSSKRQLIEAATHRMPLGGPLHRKIFM